MRVLIAGDDFLSEDDDLGKEDEVGSLGPAIKRKDNYLNDPVEVNKLRTRKIVRTTSIRENRKDPQARVTAMLMHQRRASKAAGRSDEWDDADSFSLSRLKAGEQVRLDLSAGQTLRLFLALARRYHETGTLEDVLDKAGYQIVGADEVVVPGQAQELLQRLLTKDRDFWKHLDYLQPDMLKAVALTKQQESREQALSLFAERMNDCSWLENDWDRFFRQNTWIFGYGLSYQFLQSIQNQPHYGGTTLDGKNSERGDYLMATEARARFTVLVEIKRPTTPLLTTSTYRGEKIYHASKEVNGGIAQLLANCETWCRDRSLSREVDRNLFGRGVFTHEPKGILVVGNTEELGQDSGKVGSFERCRRSLKNPEIITFDELYARAQHLVATDFDKPEPIPLESGNGWDWDENEEPPF